MILTISQLLTILNIINILDKILLFKFHRMWQITGLVFIAINSLTGKKEKEAIPIFYNHLIDKRRWYQNDTIPIAERLKLILNTSTF